MRYLNIHRLVSALNSLCEQLNDDYDINCGGCCYIAYLIAANLEKFNIKYKLIVSSYGGLNRSKVNNEVRAMTMNLRDSNSVTGENTQMHYYIMVEGGGPINKGLVCLTTPITKITSKNIYWIYQNGSWNPTYRTQNNKLIKKLINSHFRQYENTQKPQVSFSKNDTMS